MTAKRKSRLTPTTAEPPRQRDEFGDTSPESNAPPAAGLFLNNDEAAKFLNLSPRTLEKQRVIGGGPRFRKFGRRVLYAAKDLEAWANSRTFETTSDPDYTPFR